MCLAVPGKIIDIASDASIMRTGKVSFGGIIKEVNLALVPEAGIGDYVIVHAGFALSKLDEGEAKQIFEYLEAMDYSQSQPESDSVEVLKRNEKK